MIADNDTHRESDICFILEGTYPYVAGGVSGWVHDIIRTHSHLKFSLVCILAKREEHQRRYDVPDNVVEIVHTYIHDLQPGRRWILGGETLRRNLEPNLISLLQDGGVAEMAEIIRVLAPIRHKVGSKLLLNSPLAWKLIVDSYDELLPGTSFLDFFWTWRGLLGGMFSVLLSRLPKARLYHTVSTGYAGLMAARARLETQRPVILTEHGIYANERRIEIASASWLSEGTRSGLSLEKPKEDVRDLWIRVFLNYSRICYATADRIITLYEGNQILQRIDGADESKLKVVPNGIDFDRFAALPHSTEKRRPAIALIGRVVPIKDVKTYIRACGMLRNAFPDFDAYIMGPTDEDPEYYNDCVEMVSHLGLEDVVTFTGRVKLDDYLTKIDVMVLTSISEAQPLVILEAGSAGVPTVATDVGACREMLEGRADEDPVLGPGGIVTPLSNPAKTAEALNRLLTDTDFRAACSVNIQKRVDTYYNKKHIDRLYGDLYAEHMAQPDSAFQLPSGIGHEPDGSTRVEPIEVEVA